MEYKLRVGSEEHVIDASAADATGKFRVEIEGNDSEISVHTVTPNQFRIEKDGRCTNIYVARRAEGTWVWIEGRARLVQDAERARRRSSGPDATPTEVTPPTPATVVKVLVEAGQRVEKGAAAVVVSAMKMEITLSAPYSGTVTSVNTAEGAKVSPGDILVTIEPEPEANSDE